MTIELRQTRLPGVGVKYAFTPGHGGRLAVILHNDGMREIYFFRARGDEEPCAVITLDDEEARQLGAVLGGAYDRPKIVEDLEMALGELAIEWVPVPDDSPAIGKTLAECAFRARTGITIIAILREPEPVTGAQPTDIVQKGDTLVTVGKLGQYREFRRLLAEGPVGPVPTGPSHGPKVRRGRSPTGPDSAAEGCRRGRSPTGPDRARRVALSARSARRSPRRGKQRR